MSDSLATGALAGHYRIERELGQGGMATVYLAHDPKHDRDVAIKVLHPDLGAALGGERFLSEIKTTARLQHPHILPLLDSGEADGLLYYVMPLVTGETLRARLEREGQLPIADALRITRECADALGYAHGLGVIHRDIKPENILLQGGHALIADFGIALAVQHAGGKRMTQTGLSLGTPQYMSPEQAMGEKIIDARSDIYALGAVIYEMLVGEPPFTGPTVQAIVARVMTEEPRALLAQRRAVPAGVEHAVLTALEKLPADRYATAGEFAAALGEERPDTGTRGAVSRRARGRAAAHRRFRDPVVLGLGALVLALGAGVGSLAHRAGGAAGDFPLRIEITPPPGGAPAGLAALSPDGHSVVYAARPPGGTGTRLFLRRLDQLNAREIPGTQGAGQPVFAPDGKALAFIAGRRKLVRLPLDGGSAVALGEVGDDGGLDWSSSGDIVTGAGVLEGLQGLSRVSASGGSLRPLTTVNRARKELSHEDPRVLGDGRTVLFTVWHGTVDNAELAATRLDDSTVVPLGITGARALGVVDGELVYVRADGVAMAVPFDVRRLRVTGSAVAVLDSIRMPGANGDAGASLSAGGGLTYLTGTLDRRLVWVDRTGAATPALGDGREFTAVRLSPDGRRAAVNIATISGNDLWMLDFASGTLTPLTTTHRSRTATWSADGRRVLYGSTQGGRAAFWWQAADGGTPVQAAVPLHNPWLADLSPDGRTIVFNAIYDGTFNLETLALDSTHAEHDVAASPAATEGNGRFAPDGRSIAYLSDESGRPEIYLRNFPDVSTRTQVSTAGGVRPVWSRDGRALYYWEPATRRLIAATLARDPALRVVSREPLFGGRYDPEFDVAPDGRFLVIESESAGPTLVVVPSWRTELRQLTARGGVR